eukprot:1147461-Karenia_brevis.AAC.1
MEEQRSPTRSVHELRKSTMHKCGVQNLQSLPGSTMQSTSLQQTHLTYACPAQKPSGVEDMVVSYVRLHMLPGLQGRICEC